MSDQDEFTHAESIHVEAPPEVVYAVVSDVTRTGEWSPICTGCEWEDPAAAGTVGATFLGHNREPGREWTTTSTVTVADPGTAFAWEVAGGLVGWGYELAADGAGTRLTETWEFRPAGRAMFRERWGDDAENQIAQRGVAARTGIPATLAAIKRIVEAER